MPGTDGFIVEIFKILNNEILPTIHKYFCTKEDFPHWEASAIPYQNSKKKLQGNYRLVFLMNTDAEIMNKVLSYKMQI